MVLVGCGLFVGSAESSGGIGCSGSMEFSDSHGFDRPWLHRTFEVTERDAIKETPRNAHPALEKNLGHRNCGGYGELDNTYCPRATL